MCPMGPTLSNLNILGKGRVQVRTLDILIFINDGCITSSEKNLEGGD